MKPSSIRKKGQDFERSVARDVIHALRGIDPAPTAKEIHRTPLSGGHPFAQKSDLVVSDRLRPFFPFAVECKHQKIWSPGEFISGPWLRKNEEKWCQQVLRAADDATLVPLLVMAGNRTETYAALPEDYYRHLFSQEARRGKLPYAIFQSCGIHWRLLLWSAFLDLLESGWPLFLTNPPIEGFQPQKKTKKRKHRITA